MGAVSFYWECLKLAWGAVAWARTVNFVVTIFLPIAIYIIPLTPWFKEAMPNAYIWLQDLPGFITWAPLAFFLSFFIIRLSLAPYWLYKEIEAEKDKYKKIALDKVDKRKLCDDLSQFLTELNRLFLVINPPIREALAADAFERSLRAFSIGESLRRAMVVTEIEFIEIVA